MRNVTERVYIFSVYRAGASQRDNEAAHEKQLEILKGRGYSPTTVEGRYNGIDEKSILLYGTNLTEPVIENIAWDNFQESYLVIYHDGFAELVFSNGARKIIGEFRQATESDAKKKDAYSKVGSQYFVVE